MKTIEERAKEYADECCSRKGELITLKDSDVNEYIRDAFEECAKFMQQWIPIEKELPGIKENPYQVLCKNRYGDHEVLEIIDERDINFVKERNTHWRPINFK